MSLSLTGKPQLNRVVNRTLILDRIRRNGEISRAELAKVTAIRAPTVSAVVRELMEEGLVEEIGNGESRGGRAPRMISLSRKQPRALGFEVSETAIIAGVCDLAGGLCSHTRIRFTPAPPADTVNRLTDIGERLLDQLGLTWSSLHGVGVAIQGHLDMAHGVVRYSRPLGWRDVPLRRLCEERWDVTTDVMNDSAAGSMAAHFLAPESPAKNLVFLNLRLADASHGVVGLGSGLIIYGEPYHGEFGAAGEITMPVEHPLIYARDASNRPYKDIDAFVQAFADGEKEPAEALDRLGHDLAPLIVHAVNFLEPGVLVVQSDIEALRAALIDRIKANLDAHQLEYEAGKTNVVESSLGEFGIVRGAVVPTLQRVFHLPRWS